MKNILIIRTSTIRQEVESQKKELLDYVRSRSKGEIVVIGGSGASAIKLDEEYRNNINTVYQTMERGDTVWAWSIDRIGRNEEVLMQFKNRLIKAGVNLIIKNPSLELFDANGDVNSGVELAFSLFSTMAKQEMEKKQQQFKRAKKRNKEQGRFNGGRVMLGYRVVDHKFEKDPDGSKVVMDIFNRYVNEPVSCRTLAKDFHAVLNQKNMRYTETRINRILKNKQYTGNTTYPAIISNELFQRVQDKLKNFRIQPKQKYKEHPYWCQGLIIERMENGDEHRMRVKKSEISYMSYLEGFSLNINAFDSMVFSLLGDVLNSYDPSSVIEEIRRQNKAVRAKREYLERQIEESQEKDAELDERYFVTGTVRNYDALKKSIQLKIDSFKKELNSLVEVSEEYDRPTLDGLDEWQIRDTFMKYVSRIYAMKLDKWTSKIDIVTSLGISVPVIYDRKTYSYRHTDSPNWIKIDIIRDIKGRIR